MDTVLDHVIIFCGIHKYNPVEMTILIKFALFTGLSYIKHTLTEKILGKFGII